MFVQQRAASSGSSVHHSRRAISSNHLKQLFKQLEAATDSILSPVDEPKLGSSCQKLYKTVEFLCRDKVQSTITGMLWQQLEEFVDTVVENMVLEMHELPDSLDKLVKFNQVCALVHQRVDLVTRIYMFLDRTYLLNHPNKNTITKQVDYLMNERLSFGYDSNNIDTHDGSNTVDVVIRNLFFQVKESVSLSIPRKPETESILVECYGNLKQFAKFNMQEESMTFLTELFDRMKLAALETVPKSEVFDHLFSKILTELEIWNKIENDSKFNMRLKETIIFNTFMKHYDNEVLPLVQPMFENKKFNSIQNLFYLIKNTEKLTEPVPPSSTAPSSTSATPAPDSSTKNQYISKFSDVWGECVLKFTTDLIIQFQSDNDNVIDKLIKAKTNLNLFIKKSLLNDQLIEFKTRENFQKAISNQQKVVDIRMKLLKFIDSFLRNLDVTNVAENMEKISNFLLIFNSIKTKIEFLKEYKNYLSKRLIFKTTKSIELEDSLISQIAKIVGVDVCSDLDTMINDYKNNDSIIKSYQSSHIGKPPPPFDFQPLVLSNAAWPMHPKSSIKLNNELSSYLKDFKSFYKNYKKNQNLKFCFPLSTMTITAQFGNVEKYLNVSTFQGLVILLFNDHEKLNFTEIKNNLNLDSQTLSSVLYSLTAGKFKILLKDTNGCYSINNSFNDRRKVIKIKNIPMKLKGGEINDGLNDDMEDNNEVVDREGPKLHDEGTIQAFIVRLLKQETQMHHDELIKILINEFIIEIFDLKRIIEKLISLEYIKREGQDLYVYVP